MKVLVTGANGFLGQHLCLYLDEAGYSVAATNRGESRLPFAFSQIYHPTDLTSSSEVTALIQEVQPDVIIHTAAMSKPDECHVQRDACLLHNVEATRLLAQAAVDSGRNIHFIFVSTDFIFGEGGPHDETATAAPLNFYGESKWQAEQVVASLTATYTIMRPVFIYGPVWQGMRGGFIQWVKQNLEQGKPIKVVSDQQRTPAYVMDICKGLEAMIRLKAYGVYHLAGKEVLSPYQMAVAIASLLQLDSNLVEKVTADTFKEPVQRAKLAGLSISKAQAELGYNPVLFADGIRSSLL